MPRRERLDDYNIDGKKPQEKNRQIRSAMCVLSQISVNHEGPNRNKDQWMINGCPQ